MTNHLLSSDYLIDFTRNFINSHIFIHKYAFHLREIICYEPILAFLNLQLLVNKRQINNFLFKKNLINEIDDFNLLSKINLKVKTIKLPKKMNYFMFLAIHQNIC